MPIKLDTSDKKVILIAIAVAAASLWVAIRYFSHAFPEASLKLEMNRAQSEVIARQFLTARGLKVSGYRHAAIFDYDDDAKLYLERTRGLERMNQLTRGPIHLWRWSNRWFKPLQKEEFDVDVTPTGQVVGFEHLLPERAPGANLSQPAARALAESFLTGVMHRGLSQLDFVEAVSTKRPARTDYVFTWKAKDVNLGTGSYRTEVDVDGSQVAGYSEFVKIPEQWTRDYQRIRSRNDAAQVVDQVLWALLTLVMIGLLIRRLLDRDVPLRMSAIFAAVAAVLVFLSEMNEYSLSLFNYPTTASFSSFVSNYIFRSALTAAAIGTWVFLLVAAAEPVYREGLPKLASIRRTLTWRGLRSRAFFTANVVGIGLAFFFFAYQTVFYLAANHLGAWAPSDIPFSNQLNTRIPWAAVLFTGFFPAVSEEMQFRAFSIPLIRKFSRSLPVAVILSAFIWGFLHSAYPNEPFFIRGLEVGVGGIIIGFIMLRFGIFATLIWHYSVDALYASFLLLRSPNLYLRVSGGITAGVMLIPLAVALLAYLKTGTFSEEEGLSNASVGVARAPAKPAVTEAAAPLDYQPLAKSRLLWAGIVTVALALCGLIPAYRFGHGIKVQTSPDDALRAGDEWLRAQGVNPAAYRHVVWLDENVDGLALRYLLERRSLQQADQIYRQATQLVLWRIRYFHPLQKEQYRVAVNVADGKVFSFDHEVPEDAPGASLSAAAARGLAESFLSQQGYSVGDFDLQSSKAQERKARRDYTFIWQAKKGDPRNVGDAHYWLEVDLAGDRVVSLSRSFKLPEQWERQREESKLGNFILYGLQTVLGIGLLAGFTVLFVKQARAERIRWRRSLAVGAVLAAIYVLEVLVSFPLIYQGYQTSIALSAFWILVGAQVATVAVLIGGLGMLLVALAASCFPDAWKLSSAGARRIWRRDALAALAVTAGSLVGVARLRELFEDRFHAVAPVGIGLIPGAFNSLAPGASAWLSALNTSLLGAAALAILLFAMREGWRRRAVWLWLALPLVLVALGPASAHSVAAYAAGWMETAAPLAVAALLIAFFYRNNVLAYLAVAFALQAGGAAVDLFTQPPALFRWNGLLLCILSLVTLGWMLAPGARAEPTLGVEPAPADSPPSSR